MLNYSGWALTSRIGQLQMKVRKLYFGRSSCCLIPRVWCGVAERRVVYTICGIAAHMTNDGALCYTCSKKQLSYIRYNTWFHIYSNKQVVPIRWHALFHTCSYIEHLCLFVAHGGWHACAACPRNVALCILGTWLARCLSNLIIILNDSQTTGTGT